MAHPWVDGRLAVYPGTVKEGYLVKSPPLDGKGVKIKQWRQRWCVFTCHGNEPACLLYFTDRQAVLTGRMPINRVTLDSCFKVERALQHSSHPHVFAVHLPERVFYFSAASHEEMLSWVDALSSHLKLEAEASLSSLSPSHARTQNKAATLPRTLPSSHPGPEERSHTLQHISRRDQPLPALPFSCPPPTAPPDTAAAPPLPQRPEELKYSKAVMQAPL